MSRLVTLLACLAAALFVAGLTLTGAALRFNAEGRYGAGADLVAPALAAYGLAVVAWLLAGFADGVARRLAVVFPCRR